MNIIETIRNIVSQFPKISQVCDAVHVDFTDSEAESYGLSPTGDTLISEDILGNQKRQHTFVLYAVYQSLNDFDRLSNSGVLLELQQWLEKQADGQEVTAEIDGEMLTGELTKITCANGMLFEIPNGNFANAVRYQLQITAEYKLYT
ncbi:MAG: hypothetical protein NC122_07060 [Faecalibacterium sp.]|nr:hypothetical protein [Ruminococcus sp.]MCM1392262.1 hypothetical protein [Ruminococcus sp.]MCM1485950.1 hypothetical protein [Faecalibacterium sp.]